MTIERRLWKLYWASWSWKTPQMILKFQQLWTPKLNLINSRIRFTSFRFNLIFDYFDDKIATLFGWILNERVNFDVLARLHFPIGIIYWKHEIQLKRVVYWMDNLYLFKHFVLCIVLIQQRFSINCSIQWHHNGLFNVNKECESSHKNSL